MPMRNPDASRRRAAAGSNRRSSRDAPPLGSWGVGPLPLGDIRTRRADDGSHVLPDLRLLAELVPGPASGVL